jgi:putative protease
MSTEAPELLAPAGCLASLQAAIDAGADSVYFGLAQLNMRARARRSFQGSDLGEIMQRLHGAGCKGFLTLNTLLYDHDLPLADTLLDQAVAEGVDAVIVADIAAMEAARERGLEVHISTQMSISNFRALHFYSQWSNRVVLARELTLGAVERMHQRILAEDLRGPAGRLMELEVFVHGAQCIAISGRCGMSLYTRNASANRGACEQNCRRSYTVKDTETGEELVVDNNYIMSPRDLLTLPFLDQLLDSGARVLKIEGRARSPEYVSAVVSAYRCALDAIEAGTYCPELVESLMPRIESVYQRGFGSGFYLGRKEGWSRSGGNTATHRKVLVGPIQNYYARSGVVSAKVTDAGLSEGEEYVIIGPTTGVIRGMVEGLRVSGYPQVTAEKGDELSFAVDTKARRSDRLFKMVPVG